LHAGAALLLAGAIWINTGWQGGPLFVSFTAIAIVISSLLSNTFWASGFCLVFLVVSNPEFIVHTMATVVSDHALGVLAGSALAALAFHVVPSAASNTGGAGDTSNG
jgi:hypothetical protein